MSKTKVKYIVVMAVALLTMLLIGSFLDLSIANAMFSGEMSIVAILGGFVGKMPAFIMLALCFAILMNYVRIHRSDYKTPVFVLLIIAYVVVILASYVLAFYSAFEEITEKAKYIGVILGGIAAIITYFVVTKCTFRELEALKKWAVVTIISIVVLILAVLLLKTVWGRQRYLDIMASGEAYTPWYIPQGVTGGHSFPSGHTALFGALYMLLPLCTILGYKGEGVLFVFIMVSHLMVGLFRMVGGHHFLTDVTVSMALSFIIAMVATKIAYKDDYSNRVLGDKNIFRYI